MNGKGTGKASKRCHRIPKILFTRAARFLCRWGDDGELNSTGGRYKLRLESSQSGAHSDITTVIQEAENSGIIRVEGNSWAQWYTVKSTWKKRFANENTSDCAKSNYFVILGLVIHAYPEAWSEICWEEVENQLLEVIRSTCVPFLTVLDEADIKDGLKRQWLILLLKLLLRLSWVMKRKTPPNFPSLIFKGIEILRGLGTEALAEASYFDLGASIVKIQNLNETQPWVAAEDLNALGHSESKRSNASIGFALASLPSSWMTFDNQSYWSFMQWSPLSKTAPSTMEILAQAVLAGASSFIQVPGIMWPALSLESKVLIGFCEAARGSPQKGYEILEDLIEEVKVSYGSDSMEFLLSGITLVNCCNKAYEVRAEEMGRAIFQSIYGSHDLPVRIDVPQQTYFLMVVADTFLGQGNYAGAERLLQHVIEYPFTDNNTEMSARLRQLKIGRRLRRSPLDIDDWKILRHLTAGFHLATDPLKYEILEEVICFVSVLNPNDIPRGLLEPLILETIKSLSNVPISEYGGSSASNKNFIDNINTLQQYKNKLDLFSLTGPQLYFCRMIRDRFHRTTVQVAERVGAANWKRFQRIKEMWEEDDSSDNVIAQDENQDTGKSKFHDSGIGSSIGSEAKLAGHFDSGVPQVAKSIISFRSFIQNEYDAAELPPIPAENEEGNKICFICKKTLENVDTESQWRCHAFLDLRPFVGHLCHHLEEISLSAVLNEEEDFGEDEEVESSITSTSTIMYSGSEELKDPLGDELNALPPPAGKTQEQIRLEMEQDYMKIQQRLHRRIHEMEEAKAEREKKEAETAEAEDDKSIAAEDGCKLWEDKLECLEDDE
ncbi:hypothetical protein B7463_g2245, partial [Scytalidium lignicola]